MEEELGTQVWKCKEEGERGGWRLGNGEMVGEVEDKFDREGEKYVD